jgi:ribosomal protein S27AE
MSNRDDDSDPVLPGGRDDDGGETLTRECPQCGADVYEDAEQCPLCGEWFTRRLTAWQGKPTWRIILGLLGMGAVL